MSATKNSHDWHCEEHGTYGWRGESCRQCPEAPSKIKSLRAQIAELTRQRDEAVQMLADWCDAVRDNGTGWDDWDEHYKDAAWRQCGIRELIDAARGEAE